MIFQHNTVIVGLVDFKIQLCLKCIFREQLCSYNLRSVDFGCFYDILAIFVFNTIWCFFKCFFLLYSYRSQYFFFFLNPSLLYLYISTGIYFIEITFTVINYFIIRNIFTVIFLLTIIYVTFRYTFSCSFCSILKAYFFANKLLLFTS